MSSSSAVMLPEECKSSLSELSQMDNDTFLTSWEMALDHLKIYKEQEDILPYYSVQQQEETKELKSARIAKLLEHLLEQTNSDQELAKLLASSGLRKEIVTLITSQSEHMRKLISSRILQNPREHLIDLQWKFGVVAGSSSEGEAGRTFVQVKIVSKSPSGGAKARHVEMSLKKFYDFLHQLEKAKATLEYMNYL
ncbi:COMM domain-containing protein 7-like [Penaeus japonicus]|uniref:COMM domain-containing protein 7-like n=1 Tax=Penaeus japonicus TaxID=27405 RepID=UPI001C70E179|nr:COMM domain-containing protein 7-like [Penaeus japonicus]